jgi:erythromycin esterase
MRFILRNTLLFGCLATGARAQTGPGPDAFITWAKANARPIATAAPVPDTKDLAGLRTVVGKARVVGVGESIHGIREFLGLRQRIAQFLIEEMAFTAVALESGLPDSRVVYDYVLGGPVPPRLWEEGITWSMGTFAGTRELIEWMRSYNLNPAHPRKIRFYGMDVVGGNGSWSPALDQVLRYLDKVEPEYSTIARPRLTPLVEKFARPSFTESMDAYAAMPLADRLALAAYITELADRLGSLRLQYLEKSSREEYDWASRIAENLGNGNAMLTNYEARNGVNPVWNARDLAMAQNVRWIREREGPQGGVVVLAHNAHVQRAKSVAVAPNQAVLGMFLVSLIGDDYRNVGFTFNRGAMLGQPGQPTSLPTADSTSIDGVLARVGPSMFLLDLQTIPAGPARDWLNRPIKQRIQSFVTEYNQLESWNGLIFVDQISPTSLPGGSARSP